MTYKELVNSILDRLREDRVNAVSETDYSKLVGAFVNDAKRVVEDAWPWRTLVRSVNVATTAGAEASFDLEDYATVEGTEQLNERARLYRNPTTGEALIRCTTTGKERRIGVAGLDTNFVDSRTQVNASQSGQVENLILTTNPTATSGRTTIRVITDPPIPDATETYQIFLVNPQNDLSNDTDVLQVPYEPVKQMAYLYCLYERGEELGEFLTLTSHKVDAALADAIMLDSAHTSEPTLVTI